MSAEVISIILVAAGVLITLGGGFFAGLAWLLRRMDERFAKVDERLDKVDERLGLLQSEVNDVKVAVARLEGPYPRLIFPR